MSAPTLRVSEHCRVVVDNDWSGDPDGLVALAHHLLSPSNRVVAVTSSFLNPAFPGPAQRAEDGAVLARELIEVIDGPQRPPVFAGSEQPFGEESTSEAADAIVRGAREDDELPLFVACGGPLTNVATALRDAPDIAGRFTLVWIGGALDGEAWEYNRATDEAAAAFVLGLPGLAIHQFPLETYRRCAYSVAEAELDLGGSGRLGRWLWTRFTNPPDWVRIGGVWPLGDSPPLLVTALGLESSTCQVTPAQDGRAERRVYTDVDVRLIVGDLLAKLRLHAQRDQRARSQRDGSPA